MDELVTFDAGTVDQVQSADVKFYTVVDTINENVANPDEAVRAIATRVDAYLADRNRPLSEYMRRYCREAAKTMINNFARLNRDNHTKLVQDAMIVQWRTDRKTNYYKEMGFSIDSDPANPKLKQLPHFGTEIYWGTDGLRDHKPMEQEPWQLDKEDFKMHAFCTVTTAPFNRQQTPRRSERPPTIWKSDDPEHFPDRQDFRIEYYRIRLP